MSDTTTDLQAELRAQEAKMKALKKEIQKKKLEDHKRKLDIAEKRSLTDEEQEMLKTAFAKFDADSSNSISLNELQSLSKELGVTLSDEEAEVNMKALDKNGDGTLSFDEFSEWWTSDATRGGNKGLRLKLVKKRLQARIMREKASKRLGNLGAGSAAAEAGVPMSIETTVKVGEAPEENPASSVTVFVFPQTDDQWNAFKGNNEWVTAKENCKYAVEAIVNLREGVDISKVRQLCETVNETLAFVGNMMSELVKPELVLPAEGDKTLRLRVAVAIPRDEDGEESLDDDPMGPLLEAFAEISGEKKTDLTTLFTSFFASLSTKRSASDLFTWDVKAPKNSDVLDDSLLMTSTRFSNNIPQLLVRDLMSKSSYRKKDRLRELLVLSSMNRYESRHSYESTSILRQRIVASLCGMPLATLSALPEDISEEAESDIIELLTHYKEGALKFIHEGEFVNRMSAAKMMSTFVSEETVEEMSEELPGVQEVFELLSNLVGIATVTVNAPFLVARVNMDNIPVFDLFKDIHSTQEFVAATKKYKTDLQEHREGMGIDGEALDKLGEKLGDEANKVKEVGQGLDVLQETLDLMTKTLTGRSVIRRSKNAEAKPKVELAGDDSDPSTQPLRPGSAASSIQLSRSSSSDWE